MTIINYIIPFNINILLFKKLIMAWEMKNILTKTALWWWALLWADYLSNWGVWAAANVVYNVSSKVFGILSWIPLLVPWALWWYALYKWLKEEKIYDKVQKSSLIYWWVWTAAWLLFWSVVPFSSLVFWAWAWMYWVKKITSAIKDTFTSIKSIDPVDYTVKGIKWFWTWIKNLANKVV